MACFDYRALKRKVNPLIKKFGMKDPDPEEGGEDDGVL
uniref:Uncharacterized protein n=1 Tax=Siphoviridae sp. ctFRY1 TaxID=2827820 RepID=A0A8S5SU22_9CAUD|nr:MAG TPA: hypothetical protein [Siphoviridae sp. ctFRY1]